MVVINEKTATYMLRFKNILLIHYFPYNFVL